MDGTIRHGDDARQTRLFLACLAVGLSQKAVSKVQVLQSSVVVKTDLAINISPLLCISGRGRTSVQQRRGIPTLIQLFDNRDRLHLAHARECPGNLSHMSYGRHIKLRRTRPDGPC